MREEPAAPAAPPAAPLRAECRRCRAAACRPRRRKAASSACSPAAHLPTRKTASAHCQRNDSILRHQDAGVFALIDTIDLSQLAKLDAESAREEIRDIVNEIIAIKNVAMSIAEQEELLDDICNDVLGYGPLEPLLARDDIADIMVNGAGTTYIEVNGKVLEDGRPLSRQSAAAEHLPAHRQPGRPPRR
jgi:pilus assembly protein CpaF